MSKNLKTEVKNLSELPSKMKGVIREVKPIDPGFQGLLTFDPDQMIAEDEKTFDDFLNRFRQAEKSLKNLEKARETLKTLEVRNRERCKEFNIPVSDTLQIETLRKWIESAKDLEKHVGADTLGLLKFRETHDKIKTLAEKGEKILKALEHRQSVHDEEIAEVGKGYADHLHNLVRDGKVERIPRVQLATWDRSGKKFHDFGFSWTYRRQAGGSYENFCPDGDQCSEHWFWGKQGDDQGVALAKVMIRLADINWKIRNFLKRSNGADCRPGK